MTGQAGIEELNAISRQVVGAAIEVHRPLGPGLLESAYEECLVHELVRMGIPVERQVAAPLVYKGVQLDCGCRIDLQVGGELIVEIKSVSDLLPIHKAQLRSYMRLCGCRLGMLINFNVKLLRDGVKRMVLNL